MMSLSYRNIRWLSGPPLRHIFATNPPGSAIQQYRFEIPHGMCGGDFRSIRYRFERAQFCTKRCLDRHLASRTERPTSLKAWIEEARQLTPLP
jgi:hypothetical protein